MSTETIIIIVGAIIVLGLTAAAIVAARQSRSHRLREHFGDEYERLVREKGDVRQAEAELQERRHRFSKLQLRALDANERRSFAQRWQVVQARFVDDPKDAVREAQVLVEEVMTERGYPVVDWDQRQADVSVEHPEVVSNFRDAREIARRSGADQASTEDLRTGMVHYRDLFEALLEGQPEAAPSQPPVQQPPPGVRRMP